MKSKFSFLSISTELELPKVKNQLYLLLSLVDINSWKLSRVDDITLKSLNQEHFCKHILMSHNFNGCFSFAFFILSVVVSRGYVLKKKMKWLTFITELAFVWSLMCSGNINSYHSLSLSNATQLIKLKTFPNYFIGYPKHFISLFKVGLCFTFVSFWKKKLLLTWKLQK